MIWWKFSKKKGYFLMSWKVVCNKYNQGGLGVINLKFMNKVLL
jgi:hypothetical protein